MLQVSPEAAVALLIATAGLVGWLTNMSFKLGAIKSTLETKQEAHSARISEHDKQLQDHEGRISALEK